MDLVMSTDFYYGHIYDMEEILSILEKMKETGFSEISFYRNEPHGCLQMSALSLEAQED